MVVLDCTFISSRLLSNKSLPENVQMTFTASKINASCETAWIELQCLFSASAVTTEHSDISSHCTQYNNRLMQHVLPNVPGNIIPHTVYHVHWGSWQKSEKGIMCSIARALNSLFCLNLHINKYRKYRPHKITVNRWSQIGYSAFLVTSGEGERMGVG